MKPYKIIAKIQINEYRFKNQKEEKKEIISINFEHEDNTIENCIKYMFETRGYDLDYSYISFDKDIYTIELILDGMYGKKINIADIIKNYIYNGKCLYEHIINFNIIKQTEQIIPNLNNIL